MSESLYPSREVTDSPGRGYSSFCAQNESFRAEHIDFALRAVSVGAIHATISVNLETAIEALSCGRPVIAIEKISECERLLRNRIESCRREIADINNHFDRRIH